MPRQDGRDDGNVSPRDGKELTVQSVAVQGETGARIASSSASASKVKLKTSLPVLTLSRWHLSPCFWKLLLHPRVHGTSL